MHKSEKSITTKMNIMHKALDENIVCLDRIVDKLSSYIPTNFQQLSSRKFHFFEKLMSLENRHQKLSNLKPVTSNDHNF
jgi:hypothetical protein